MNQLERDGAAALLEIIGHLRRGAKHLKFTLGECLDLTVALTKPATARSFHEKWLLQTAVERYRMRRIVEIDRIEKKAKGPKR